MAKINYCKIYHVPSLLKDDIKDPNTSIWISQDHNYFFATVESEIKRIKKLYPDARVREIPHFAPLLIAVLFDKNAKADEAIFILNEI
jgi:hypothetical protein